MTNNKPNSTFGRRCLTWIVVTLAVVAFLAAAGLYHYIKTGGLIARQKPSALEAFVAQGLVNLSIPGGIKALKNPLGTTSAAVAAGRVLYHNNCEICHGYDGKGKTMAGGGMYPPPADLSQEAAARRTDGELFYFIRNGVRNTAMPGWQLPDEATWQLVSYLRSLPLTASLESPANTAADLTGAHYVGSAACQSCHSEIYDHWKKTPMATWYVIPANIQKPSCRIFPKRTPWYISPPPTSLWFMGASGNSVISKRLVTIILCYPRSGT